MWARQSADTRGWFLLPDSGRVTIGWRFVWSVHPAKTRIHLLFTFTSACQLIRNSLTLDSFPQDTSILNMVGKRATRLSGATLRGGAERKSRTSLARTQPQQHQANEDASDGDFDASDASPARETKRRKTGSSRAVRNADLCSRLFGDAPNQPTPASPCELPVRQHALMYHRPLLLDGQQGKESRQSLLRWFDSVSTTRAMPWRKAWVNPRDMSDSAEVRRVLERRAYEVWISEIMLQQTRVAVVIDYWNRWMARWPTIQDLADADPEDVLAAWRGLGYYSRATRIHDASKLVVHDTEMQGLLPESVEELDAKVPGVGRYTAGAISAIVFGRAAPMVDGNVLRVLSRQLGIYGNVKTDKAVIDVLWAAADVLVKAVAHDGAKDDADDAEDQGHHMDAQTSDRPGRWGQALMELGSTVCTPKPNCSACPISSTCRVYNEGRASNIENAAPLGVVDVEDICNICEPFDDLEGEAVEANANASPATSVPIRAGKTTKQATLASFAFTREAASKPATAKRKQEPGVDMEKIVNHAKKFPLKVVKKAVREEETLVCAIRQSNGRYLIHRRPQKGLLAGLWEFPSCTLDGPKDTTAKQRKQLAQSHASKVLGNDGQEGSSLRYVGDLGSVPWLFSHLKLTMHVHLFAVDVGATDGETVDSGVTDKTSRWTNDVEGESMGTGMRKCWALVQEAME